MSKIESSNILVDLAERIRIADSGAEAAAAEAAAKAIEAGHLLVEAKEACRHGEWLTFLKHIGMPSRRAQKRMALARSGIKCDVAAHLGIEFASTVASDLTALEDHEIATGLLPVTERDGPLIAHMAAAMGEHGYLQCSPPVILYERRILDGRLHVRAACRAGVFPPFEVFDGDWEKAVHLWVSCNVARASYNDDQRAMISLRLEEARVDHLEGGQ